MSRISAERGSLEAMLEILRPLRGPVAGGPFAGRNCVPLPRVVRPGVRRRRLPVPLAARLLLWRTEAMQETFLKKLVLSLVVAASLAGLIEFYKTFIDGADKALNGQHGSVHFNARPTPHH